MANKTIFLLHGKQGFEILFGKLHFIKRAKNKCMKACIPPPLKRILVRGRHYITIMGFKVWRYPCPDIIIH
jgi:hypothetical protein